MPRQIMVQFSPEFTALLESGQKIATTRYHRIGHVADFFNWNGHYYTIDLITRHHLWFIAQHYFAEEGFKSSQQFIDWWCNQYQARGFHPQEKVFYHSFFRET